MKKGSKKSTSASDKNTVAGHSRKDSEQTTKDHTRHYLSVEQSDTGTFETTQLRHCETVEIDTTLDEVLDL